MPANTPRPPRICTERSMIRCAASVANAFAMAASSVIRSAPRSLAQAGPIGEQAARGELCCRLGDLVLDQLERTEGAPELAPVRGVGHGFVERASGHAAGGSRYRRPKAVQRRHPDLEPPTLGSQAGILRHHAPHKRDLAQGMRRTHEQRAVEAEPPPRRRARRSTTGRGSQPRHR